MHPKLTESDVVARLAELGYFERKDKPSKRVLKETIKSFQKFHGIKPTGLIDDQTATRLLTPLRCGSPDMLATGTSCKWPLEAMPHVSYYVKLDLPGITVDQALTAYDMACRQWEVVCGIKFRRTDSKKNANITARSGLGKTMFLDGRGGTLAWSHLPCGAQADTQLPQMYDAAERWSNQMLLAVACHEVGHAIGLSHAQPGQLMAPCYNADITAPQAGDISEAMKLYGAPQPQALQGPVIVQVTHGTTIEIRNAIDDSVLMVLEVP